MESKYTYQPLPDPANSIRLLSVEPGWPSDPIRANIQIVTHLNDSPCYQALSYVWGSVENPVPIKCDDCPMQVTRNLASALAALRQLPSEGDPTTHGISVVDESHILHSKQRAWKDIARNRNEVDMIESRRASQGPLLFWIDALCINQDDMQERAEQVKLMRRIYTTASMVCIWLGDELVAPDILVSDLRTSRLDRAFGRKRLADIDYMSVVLSFFAQALRNSHRVTTNEYGLPDVDLLGFPSQKTPEHRILGAFFNQPWFHRVWIVQEAVLAQNAKILVGAWELDWKPFAEAVNVMDAGNIRDPFTLQLRVTGVTSEESSAGVDIPAALYLCQIQQLPGRKESLFPLLNKSRTRKATNPADHVFAVLGIAGDVANATDLSSKLVAVNYEKPVGQVFRDATWFIILTHATLRPLTAVEILEDPSVPDCPSWTPVWSEPRRTSAFDYDFFSADANQKMSMKATGNADLLQVAGHLLDSVGSITDPLIDANTPLRAQDELIEWHYPPHQAEIDFVISALSMTTEYYNRRTSSGDENIAVEAVAQDLTNQLCLPTYTTEKGVFEAFVSTLSVQTNGGSPDDRGDEAEDMVDSAEAWFQQNVGWSSHPASWVTKIWHIVRDKWYPGAGMLFQAALLRSCVGRRFFITKRGFIGIGPACMKAGDLVAVILGVPVPFIIRKTGDQENQKYVLLGECYVDGIMEGELVHTQQKAGKEAELFTFV
ncbi:heterokaryon incompatibility protein-domain-containing protein [Annulohypoxylon truncatum]|uniref:heterokaryon incompatibility protein-domain-containing protein n=1 Tax=Annulohypoxylon truncatum TaxID=327061 RepID=UPI0020074F98|nr:heterokaryon incompatibility protein-domain-containing protein [Annulohypoxylon truncatum]KAI1213864.1 heterokaryon incompatibility protein-domain-containing protein [Annulohypoxylon truncatum]